MDHQQDIIKVHQNYDLELVEFKEILNLSVDRKVTICTLKPTSIIELNNSKQEYSVRYY